MIMKRNYRVKVTANYITLDCIFDDATVFRLRGESFCGKILETVSLQTGKLPAVEPVFTEK